MCFSNEAGSRRKHVRITTAINAVIMFGFIMCVLVSTCSIDILSTGAMLMRHFPLSLISLSQIAICVDHLTKFIRTIKNDFDYGKRMTRRASFSHCFSAKIISGINNLDLGTTWSVIVFFFCWSIHLKCCWWERLSTVSSHRILFNWLHHKQSDVYLVVYQLFYQPLWNVSCNFDIDTDFQTIPIRAKRRRRRSRKKNNNINAMETSKFERPMNIFNILSILHHFLNFLSKWVRFYRKMHAKQQQQQQ